MAVKTSADRLKNEQSEYSDYEMGKDYWAYTSCYVCTAECAMRVHVIDGVPVKMEGIKDSPMGAEGGLCGKCLAQVVDFHSPNRVNYPVKRGNQKKGIGVDPQWQRISWDEALDTIVEKLKPIQKKNPNGLLFGGIPGNGAAWNGLWYAFGSQTLHNGGAGLHCGNGSHFHAGLMTGAWSIAPDYPYCNLVLFFGTGKGTGAGHAKGKMMNKLAALRARGARVIAFDPQAIFSGGKATEWVPILPGTDSAVILAICNLIANEFGGYDKPYLKTYTNAPYLVGPDRLYVRDVRGEPMLWDEKDSKAKPWDDPTLTDPAIEGHYKVGDVDCQPCFQLEKDHLKQYTPEWASGVSTVPADKIRRIAREFLTEARVGSTIEIEGVQLPYRPAAAAMFRGGQGHTNSYHQYFSMMFLNMLVGNVDMPGGCIGYGVRQFGFPETGVPKYQPFVSKDGLLAPGWWMRRVAWPLPTPQMPDTVTLTKCAHHGSAYPFSDDFQDIWTKAGRPVEIEAVAWNCANLVKSCANSRTLEKWLLKIPFIFSLNTAHHEFTEGFCDIVLPRCHSLERLDIADSMPFSMTVPQGMSNHAFHLRQPVIKPKYERRQIFDICGDIADRLGIRDKWFSWASRFIAGVLTEDIGVKDTGAEGWGRDPFSKKNILARIEKVGKPNPEMSNKEFADWGVKYLFNRDLEWFKKHGYVVWKKYPEEAYWRPFVKCRSPIYYEHIVREREPTRQIGEQLGMHMNWEQFQPMPTFFMPVLYTQPAAMDPNSGFDMIAFSYRDNMIAGTTTVHNPWVYEQLRTNPYSLNVCMNIDTAKKKGIKDGDQVFIEIPEGYRVKGTVKLMEGMHPKCVSTVGGPGAWSRGSGVGLRKGVNFNDLLMMNHRHIDPVVQTIETAALVKVYKAEKLGEEKEEHLSDAVRYSQGADPSKGWDYKVEEPKETMSPLERAARTVKLSNVYK